LTYKDAIWLSLSERRAFAKLGGPRLRYALEVVTAVLAGLGYKTYVTRFQEGPPSPVHTALRALDLRTSHVKRVHIGPALEAVNEALPGPFGSKYPTMIFESPSQEKCRALVRLQGARGGRIVHNERASFEHFHLQVPGGCLSGTVWDLSSLPSPGGVE
jgi:hypothetical protein